MSSNLLAQEDAAARRRELTQYFHLRSQERTGVLVPMYVYPANVHTNEAFNRLIEIKRKYETVPCWVILNPASGPGKQTDANYTKAIDRLQGAGCVVLGYVTTSYGKRPAKEVQADIDQWMKLYPRAHGVFFDEMIYEDTPAAAAHQRELNQYAKRAGYWPTVANPGANTPGRYFEADAADVIIVHESDAWPAEGTLKGDYFGGYADYPPFTRGLLLYSQAKLDLAKVDMVRRYTRWIYVTEDEYRANDPAAPNPWDTLSRHLDALCEHLSR